MLGAVAAMAAAAAIRAVTNATASTRPSIFQFPGPASLVSGAFNMRMMSFESVIAEELLVFHR
jgi:hypothetical protein